MVKSLVALGLVMAGLGLSCRPNQPRPSLQRSQESPSVNPVGVVVDQVDDTAFRLETLNEDMVRLANKDYGMSHPDYSNPDNNIGTPPFQFVKRIDCDVIRVDEDVEKQIKRASDSVSFHTIVILKDARKDLYAFTLTSTVPDKKVVHLQHYGPLTDENPNIIDLPINQRRLTRFPKDFNTGKALYPRDGRCIYVPYPFPADQEYWVFGSDPHLSPLQGLYRNDRFSNVDEIIGLIVQAVKQQETSLGSPAIR